MGCGLRLSPGLSLQVAFDHPAVLLEGHLVGERSRRLGFGTRGSLNFETGDTAAQRLDGFGIESGEAGDLLDQLQLRLKFLAYGAFLPNTRSGARVDGPLRC